MQTLHWIQQAVFGCCSPAPPAQGVQQTIPLLQQHREVIRVVVPPTSLNALASAAAETRPLASEESLEDRKHSRTPSPRTVRPATPIETARTAPAHISKQSEDEAVISYAPHDDKSAPQLDTKSIGAAITDEGSLTAWVQRGQALVDGWFEHTGDRADALARLLSAATEASEACQPEAARLILRWLPQLLEPVMRHDFGAIGPALSPADHAAAGDVLQGFLQGLKMRGHGACAFHGVLAQAISQSPQGTQSLGPILKAIQYFLRYPVSDSLGQPLRCRAALNAVHRNLYREFVGFSGTTSWTLERRCMVSMLRDCTRDEKREARLEDHFVSEIPGAALDQVLEQHCALTSALAKSEALRRRNEVITGMEEIHVTKDVAGIVADYDPGMDMMEHFDWREPLN